MFDFNGTLLESLPPELAQVQRGWMYGDSLFESIRVFGGRLPLWSHHWERLRAGSRLLDYDWPSEWTEAFFQEKIRRVLPGPDARVRLTLWRSPGGLYRPANNRPQYLVSAQALNADRYEWYQPGLKIGVCTSVQLPVDAYSGIKTLNAPRYVAAALEAQRNGWDDGLLLNAKGNIVEATNSNVFWRKGNTLYTPPLSDGPVTGTLRNLLLSLTSVKKVPICEKSIRPAALLEADEVFLTNAVQGIRWVKYLEKKEYSHPKTRQLFEETVEHLWGNPVQ